MRSLIDAPVDPRHRAPSLAPLASVLATQVVAEALERPVTDSQGEPLPVGCAMEIGYFSRAQMALPFRGKWVPLAGRFSTDSNRGIQFPRIGDGGAGPGCYAWRYIFKHGIDTLAPVNIPLAIRFYDHAAPQAARHYNTVSNSSWWCRPPKAGTPALVFMSLDFDGAIWESGERDGGRTCLPVFGSMFARLMALGDADTDSEI